MKSIIFILCAGLLSLNAQAASFCNAGGADTPICTSLDGKTAIFIHPRYYYTTGVSINGFCNSGYIKINGIELNGPMDGQGLPDNQAALEGTEAVTSDNGLTVQSPRNQKELINVNTTISFQLSDKGIAKLNDPKVNSGHVLLLKDQKTAYMYLFNDDVLDVVIPLTCQFE
jgi:hypothetical protein